MKKGNILLWVVILVVLVGGGYMLLKGKNASKMTQEAKVAPTVAAGSASPMVNQEGKTTEEGVTVKATSVGFDPKTITVKVGTKVIWINTSGGMSNVSSAVHPTHLVYPPLNLGDFANSKSVSLIFKDKGTFKYHNHLDASQTGEVVVE